MGETEGLRQRLQFAIAVRDTHGADVIAFDEQQLECHQPIVRKAVGIGADRHAVLYRCRAGGQQATDAGDLDQAQTAGPRRAKPFQMAQGRDVLAVVMRHLEDVLSLGGGAELAVDAD